MPPLGLGREWFRPAPATKNDNSQEPKVSDHDSSGGGIPLISREEMEVEYLNEISKLAKETEEARDEIERRTKESENINTSLRESNESLQSKVEELEAKLRSKETPDDSTDLVSELRSEELIKMKSKLEKYNESNKALSAKVQKLRERYAQRRKDEDDELSDISSVGSLSILSSQLSTMSATSASRISNRQHFAQIKNLKMKYDNELAKNKELEEKLTAVERNKETSEKLLEELKLTSAERMRQHEREVEKLQGDFTEAKESLMKLQNRTREDLPSGSEAGTGSSSAELEKSRLKILDLEENIKERKKEIEYLNSQLKEMGEMKDKFQELNNTVIQLEQDLRLKSAEIEALQRDKEESLAKLQLIESEVNENKAKSSKSQEGREIENNKDLYIPPAADSTDEIQRMKVELEKSKLTVQSLENTILQLREKINTLEKQNLLKEKQEMPVMMEKIKEEVDLKAKLDELERKYADEVELSSSLKEQLSKSSKKEGRSDEEGNNNPEESDNLSNLLREKEDIIVQLKGESSQKEEALGREIALLKTEIQLKEEKILKTNEEMNKLIEERDQVSSNLQDIETALVETKLKSAQYMQDLEDVQTKYLEEKKRCSELEEDVGNNPGDESKKMKRLSHQHQEDLKKIRELQATVAKKEKEIKDFGSKSRDLLRISDKVKKLEEDLGDKTEQLNKVKNEKKQSIQKLETLEMDFALTQQKGAKTWEELEDLKEKYQNEKRLKDDLQNQIKQMDSAEKLIQDAKKLSDAALKERDNEIDKLKKQLTEANIAKGATEKKLVGVINESVAQQNEREEMRLELEEQLKNENDNAKKLEDLIKVKEGDVERVREDFRKLIANMNDEMDKKRNEITELNGEVLVKSNLLAKRERDIEYMKSEMDDLKLKHSSEVFRLRKELDASVDKVELERLRKYNSDLEYNITSLNQEIGKLRLMFVHQTSSESTDEGTLKILRDRNNKLKKDVEKLTAKLHQAKKEARREI